jgi:hypothetical protein
LLALAKHERQLEQRRRRARIQHAPIHRDLDVTFVGTLAALERHEPRLGRVRDDQFAMRPQIVVDEPQLAGASDARS